MKKFLLAAALVSVTSLLHADNGLNRLTLPGNQYYYGGFGGDFLSADGHAAVIGGDMMMMGGSYYYSASTGLVDVEHIITGLPSANYSSTELLGVSSAGSKLLVRSNTANFNGNYLVDAVAGTSQLISVAGTGFTSARGISANGQFVVGSYYTQASNVSSGFLWGSTGAPVLGIGASFGNDSYLTSVRSDGTLALGGYWSGSNSHAFVWKQAGGTETSFAQVANLAAGKNSYLRFVTADLSLALVNVYGNGSSTTYRWSPATGQAINLDLSAVSVDSEATGLSDDGSTVVARAANKVHRWTASGWNLDVTSGLGNVQSAYSFSSNGYGYGNTQRSTNVSSDGSALVGVFEVNNRTRPFYWSTTTGAIDILSSVPAAQQSGPYPIISADGKVVFCGTWDGARNELYRWTAARGGSDDPRLAAVLWR